MLFKVEMEVRTSVVEETPVQVAVLCCVGFVYA